MTPLERAAILASIVMLIVTGLLAAVATGRASVAARNSRRWPAMLWVVIALTFLLGALTAEQVWVFVLRLAHFGMLPQSFFWEGYDSVAMVAGRKIVMAGAALICARVTFIVMHGGTEADARRAALTSFPAVIAVFFVLTAFFLLLAS